MLEIVPGNPIVPQGQDQGLTLRDAVFVLFRRRWIILAVALPIILVGGISLFRQTGSYTASARVVVELIKVDLPRWNITGRNIDFDRELSTLSNIAMSLPVGEAAAIALEDSIQVMIDLDPMLKGIEEPGVLKDFLLEGMDVSVVGESTIIELRFTSTKPRISLMAVGALRDAFVEFQGTGRKNLQAINYYDEQIETVRDEITQLMNTRSELLVETGYSSIKDDFRNEAGLKADLKVQLLETITELRTLEAEYNLLLVYLDDDPRFFPMGQNQSQSEPLVYWRHMVSKHEDELNSILTVHTKDSIPAKRQASLLEQSLVRLKMEEKAYVESIGLKIAGLRERQAALRSHLGDSIERNQKGPLVYQKVSLLDIEIESLRQLLEELQGKMGEVRISQMADARVSSLANLTNPQLISVLSGGKTMVYFAMVVIFSLALGVVSAFILENLDHRVYAPKDVETNLNLPVFVSVSRTD